MVDDTTKFSKDQVKMERHSSRNFRNERRELEDLREL